MRFLLLVCTVVLAFIRAAAKTSTSKALIAGTALAGEELGSGQWRQYCLGGFEAQGVLRPSTQYEVRISSTAALPFKFTMEWTVPNRHRRRLLDTEKVMFWTNHLGNATDNGSLLCLLVTSTFVGVPATDSTRDWAKVTFDIVLEELLPWISAPVSLLPLGMFLVAAIPMLWCLALFLRPLVFPPAGTAKQD